MDCRRSIFSMQPHLAFSPSLFMVAVILMSACMPDPLEVDDFEVPETRMVVSSAVLPDSSVAVLLTRSLAALEANSESDPQELISEIAINDAQVTITSNGMVYHLSLLQDGVYQGVGIPLIAGTECHLKVVSKAFGQVTASTIVQAPVYFDTVNAEAYANEHDNYWAQVTYTIEDPPHPNYYVLNVQEAKRKDVVEDILKPDAFTRRLEDKTFNEQRFSERFRAMNEDLYPGDSIEVSISNVSVEYFNYVRLREENDLELAELFSEPIYYPTNIQGGYGFFNLHLTDIRVLAL